MADRFIVGEDTSQFDSRGNTLRGVIDLDHEDFLSWSYLPAGMHEIVEKFNELVFKREDFAPNDWIKIY